jgi:uncharacterized membrane protein
LSLDKILINFLLTISLSSINNFWLNSIYMSLSSINNFLVKVLFYHKFICFILFVLYITLSLFKKKSKLILFFYKKFTLTNMHVTFRNMQGQLSMSPLGTCKDNYACHLWEYARKTTHVTFGNTQG